MAETQATAELVSRKQVRLRLRPNLVFTTREEGGQRVHIVKDPVSLQYFHLDDAQRFTLEQMDGRRTLEEVQQAFEHEFRPRRLPLDELESFGSQLLQRGLVESPAANVGRQIYRRLEKGERLDRWARLLNVFYIKAPLLQPDRLLDRVAFFGRVLFHPLFVAAAALLCLAALCLVIARWDGFLQRLPAYQDFFTLQTLLYLWLAFGLVKVLHELSHALCARHVGGEVHDMGVVFLLFFPTLYCNVTDTCRLPSKWKRMAVSAAGVYVEVLIAALAVVVWWLTIPTSFLHNLCFALMLVCGVHTLLFNANPLMRFDGYFILADWMEIPNMAQAAGRRMRDALRTALGLPVAANPSAASASAPGRERFLLVYGVASLVYRCVVFGTVLWLLYLFLKDKHLQWLGVSLILFAILSMLIWPAVRLVQAIRKQGGASFQMKPRRVWLAVAAAVSLVLLVGFVRWPMKVRGLALVQAEPATQFRLMAPNPGGVLERICVRDGQAVRQGDVLFVLRNPELERKLRLLAIEQSLRLEQRQVVLAQLAAPVLAAPLRADVESHQEIEHALVALDRQHAALKSEADALTLRAPADGVIVGLPRWEVQGQWLEAGHPLGMVADASALRATVLVEPADRQLFGEGSEVTFLPHGVGILVPGTVAGIAQVEEDAIPPRLASRAGGDVPTRQDPSTKAEQPYKHHYLVTIRLPEAAPVHVGVLGRVRIDAGSATLWWRFRHWLGATFRG